MRPRAYHDLWALATDLALSSDGGRRNGPAYTFDCSGVGLILRPEEGRNGYDWTPLNADTFAETGGDGVHFSLLLADDGRPIEDAPVVMTVPMAFDSPNHVVGESLLDFLALGCRYGYFALEQLAYDHAGTAREIQASRGPDPSDPGARMIDAINRRFGLQPWHNVAAKLADLNTRYGPSIQLGPWTTDI